MDKISGIIPGSSRVTSVDMKDSTPVRPGTPAFGRPEHVVRAKEVSDVPAQAPAQTPSQKGAASPPQNSGWKDKDSSQAALVAKLSDGFFGRPAPEPKETENQSEGIREMSQKPQQDPRVSRTPERESANLSSADGKTDEFNLLRGAQMRPVDSFGHEEQEERMEEMPRLRQPEGLYPKGSFIDRTA